MKYSDSDDKRALVCFTAAFPFGMKETFFENELPFLAERFSSIFILPRYNPNNESSVRTLPYNVFYFAPQVPKSKFRRIIKGVFNTAPLSFYIDDFFELKVFRSKSHLKTWFNSLLVFRANYRWQKKVISEVDEQFSGNVLLYSYWAEAPIFLTRFCKIFCKILRMHRVDFYLEANDGYLPLRKRIYDSTDLLLPISDNIGSILTKHYEIADSKIFISRLGVNRRKKSLYAEEPDLASKTIRIVSCSRVEPVKRVQLIAEALCYYEGDDVLEWHHFGDGSQLEELQNKVAGCPENVVVKLHGWSSQDEIFSFYENNYVHWLVNVSESEGIPVSIMEAMSYAIPVIATNVGATSEIVNASNGRLFDVNVCAKDLLQEILLVDRADYQRKRNSALETWRAKYFAKTNYTQLGEKLVDLLSVESI